MKLSETGRIYLKILVKTSNGINKKGEAHAAALTSWAAVLLSMAIENEWSEGELRKHFANYLKHYCGEHAGCLPNAKCKEENYVPDASSE